jgi:hypothetical protein
MKRLSNREFIVTDCCADWPYLYKKCASKENILGVFPANDRNIGGFAARLPLCVSIAGECNKQKRQGKYNISFLSMVISPCQYVLGGVPL